MDLEEAATMIRDLTKVRSRIHDILGAGDHPAPGPLTALRAATAQLLVLTGTETTIEHLRANGDPLTRRGGRTPTALVWAPALLGPLAAAAQLAHAGAPSPATERATRILNTSLIGVGLGLALADILDPGPDSGPPLYPLALASSGLMGWLLDREESRIAERDRRLRRRANIVDRMVPRRKAKLDRIVVHV
jgi:hypothetical protein